MSFEAKSPGGPNQELQRPRLPSPDGTPPPGNRAEASGGLEVPLYVNPEPQNTLTVLLPALNEEVGIVKVLEELPQSRLRSEGYRTSVVVVDGQSSDRTRDIARAWGAQVFVQSQRGKGKAIRGVVPLLHGDYAVMLDADGSYPAGAILEFVRRLASGYDVVSGSRLDGSLQKEAMTGLHRLGNRLLTALANLLFRPARTTDLCTGFWAFRIDVLKRLWLSANGFDLEADLYAEVVNRDLRHAEVPITYEPREGRAKLSWKHGIDIAWTLIKKRLDAATRERFLDHRAVEDGDT